MTTPRWLVGIVAVLLVSCTPSSMSSPDTSKQVFLTYDPLGLTLKLTETSATLSGSWVTRGTTCTGFSLEAAIFTRTRSLDDFDQVVPIDCSVGMEQLIYANVPISHTDALEQGFCIETDQVREGLLRCLVQRDARVSLVVYYSY